MNRSEIKTIKILNASKTPRPNNFESLEDALQYIKDNDVHAIRRDLDISIETTTKEYDIVKVDFPELNENYKKGLIRYLYEYSERIKNVHIPNMITSRIINDKTFGENKISEYNDILYVLVKEELGLSDDTLIKYYNKNIWDSGYIQPDFHMKLLEGEAYERIVKRFVSYIIDNNKIQDIRFKYVSTDYKPCNNIYFKIGPVDFQIRTDDIVFNNGELYGRNVNIRKVYDLTNKHVENSFISEYLNK